jgi:hypothetical protein
MVACPGTPADWWAGSISHLTCFFLLVLCATDRAVAGGLVSQILGKIWVVATTVFLPLGRSIVARLVFSRQ